MRNGLLLLRHYRSFTKHDLRGLRRSGRSRNLRIRVVYAVQLSFSLGMISEDGAGSRNLFFRQRLLQIDDEVGSVGILGVLE